MKQIWQPVAIVAQVEPNNSVFLLPSLSLLRTFTTGQCVVFVLLFRYTQTAEVA